MKSKRDAVVGAVHKAKGTQEKKKKFKVEEGEREHPTQRGPPTAPLKVGLLAWRHGP